MAYIKKEPIMEFITNGLNNPDKTKAFGYDAIEILTEIEQTLSADVVDIARAKALEEDLERAGNELAKVEAERDALLEELQRLADCSSCKFNTPDAVDGCSALMPCKDGSMWEWKGVKNE